ncbi:MAG: dipeptidase PepE [Bacteroidetes bacterium]|nr:dipeptidase PepE [Bacteroidota bacterium]MDA1121171.1 dipeptidase PepE [Bacteroidota bacterium]
MPDKRLLLLSNSTNLGEGYLEYPQKTIQQFLGNSVKNVLFIPYAGVGLSYNQYTQKVASSFAQIGYQVRGIHAFPNPVEAVLTADAIVIGGGNTFALLNQLYLNKLINPIRKVVANGIPFLGWSAGSNVASPTIKTTNDMPIVEPPSFEALNLVPFQINPHYTESRLPNHGGESRVDRLNEFIELNPGINVVAIPEGDILKIVDNSVKHIGTGPIKVFRRGQKIIEFDPSDNLDFLMD